MRLILFLFLLEQSAWSKPFDSYIRFESTLDPASVSAGPVASSLRKILNQNHIGLRIDYLPMQRGIEEIKKQRVHGSVARIGRFAAVYDIPHYERVNFPILSFTLLLVCDPKIEEKVKSEPATKVRLGFLLGSTLALQVIKYIDRPDVITVRFNNYRSGISMLDNARIDCFVGSDSVMAETGIRPEELDQFRVNRILVYELFIWLDARFSNAKAILERELPKYPFDKDWVKKYRSAKSICASEADIICPDGIIFHRMQTFTPRD